MIRRAGTLPREEGTKRSDVTLTFGSESTSTDVEAFAVECRYSNLAGGYKKTDRGRRQARLPQRGEVQGTVARSRRPVVLLDAAGVDEEGDSTRSVRPEGKRHLQK